MVVVEGGEEDYYDSLLLQPHQIEQKGMKAVSDREKISCCCYN